jgi:nucleotide-binding universal stress UspA family protein
MNAAKFRRILCAADFSEQSRRALDHAVALARWSGAELAIVNAVAPPDFRLIGASLLAPAERVGRLEALRRFAEPVMGPFAARLVLREGEAAREIVAESRGWAADLVVVGTHGRRGLEHWELGSVAEQVIRTAPCPVLTVSRASRLPRPAGEVPFRSVLCALDLGPLSPRTLEYALSLAIRARAAASVLYAMEDVPEAAHRMQLRLGAAWFAAYRDSIEKEARARLRRLLPDEVRVACHVDEIVVAGKARRQIVRLAAEREVDLVVMGAHGARRLQETLFGSTAARVVRQAPCPVLTVPARAAVRLPGVVAGRAVALPAH